MADEGELARDLLADKPAPVPLLTDLCCRFLAHHHQLLFYFTPRSSASDDTTSETVIEKFYDDSNLSNQNAAVSDVLTVFLHGDAKEGASTSTWNTDDDDVAILAACMSCGKVPDVGSPVSDKSLSQTPWEMAECQGHPGLFIFRPEATPPRGLSERLLGALRNYCECERRSDRQFLEPFVDEQCCLQHLNLKNSDVDDFLLCRLLHAHGARLLSLDLSSCVHLTSATNVHLTSSHLRRRRFTAPKLSALTVNGSTLRVFEHWLRGLYSVETNCGAAVSPSSPCSSQPASAPKADESSSNCNLTSAAVNSPSASSSSGSTATSAGNTPPPTFEGQRHRAVKRRSSSTATDECYYSATANRSKHTTPPNKLDKFDSSPDPLTKLATDLDDSCNEAAPCCSKNFYEFAGDADYSTSTTLDENFSTFAYSSCAMQLMQNPIFTDICPNLTKLVLHGDELELIWAVEEVIDKERIVWEFFARLLHPIGRNLRHLDISYWSNLNDLSFLEHRPLATLILHDVPHLYKAVPVLCTLNRLECLDISQSKHETGQYLNPVTTLTLLISSLPKLRCLDISVTNLASNPTKGDWPTHTECRVQSDIYGLQGLRRKLDFLGIFYCNAVSSFKIIPAINVGGDDSEQQLLLAAERYTLRPRLLLSVLNEMFDTYKFDSFGAEKPRALHLLLDAMHKYGDNVGVQISCTASLFYIMRGVKMNFATTERAVGLFLSALDRFVQEHTLVRNCCLSLCQFDVVVAMLHVYVESFRILLNVLHEFTADTMLQRLVVHIFNSLACTGQSDQKVAVGQLGALTTMLTLITQRLDAENCDEVMEMAWSFLWNITDETPVNCRMFLDEGGMDLFKKCRDVFPNKNGLLRNMMGLMGNIAEVHDLRHRLLHSDYVVIFCELLHNLSDGIEISYNSAGVLAHLLSGGSSKWTISFPDREFVSQEVIKAVKSWDLTTKRYINYRSFEPIIRLLGQNSNDASRYWAVWALASLTTADGARYCKFVVDENGVDALKKSVLQCTDANFRDLVGTVLRNVTYYASLLH